MIKFINSLPNEVMDSIGVTSRDWAKEEKIKDRFNSVRVKRGIMDLFSGDTDIYHYNGTLTIDQIRALAYQV